MARNGLGVEATPFRFELFTYAIMALFWGLGLGHRMIS
jgi:hypothetical protein